MKLTIESTDELTQLDNATCRVWHGTTENGVPCVLYVRAIRVWAGVAGEFEQEAKGAVFEVDPPMVAAANETRAVSPERDDPRECP